MSPIKRGSSDVTAIYRGGTQVTAVYRGGSQVFGGGTTVTPATVRAVSTATPGYASTAPINKPSGTAEGDLLVLFVFGDYGSATNFAPPAGFTELVEHDLGNNLSKVNLSYKVATASEPSSYSASVDSGADTELTLFAVQDWSGNTADIRAVGAASPSSNTTHSAPSVTPATEYGLAIAATGHPSSSASQTWSWTPPSGYTEHSDLTSGGGYMSATTASRQWDSTAAIPAASFTVSTSAAAAQGVGAQVIIPSKVSSGGSTPPPPSGDTTTPATVRSSTSRTHSSSNTTDDNVLVPSDAVAGDLLLAYIMGDTGTATEMGKPTGFTQLTELVPSAGPRINVSYRVAQAGDAGTTFAFESYPSGSDGASICVCVKDWSGVTSEIAVTSGQATRSGTSPNITVVAPSVTPVTSHGLLLSSIAMDEDSSSGRTWTFTPPSPMALVSSQVNASGWSALGVGGETWADSAATGTRTWTVSTNAGGTVAALSSIVVPSKATSGGDGGGGSGTGDYTGGSGGELVNVVEATYDNGVKTSRYNLYASGLDWTKDVGLLIYCDGSGDWGIDNASDPYLMAGTDGLVNVAKRNNMVLLTPFAPGDGCTDGDGVCWYMDSFDGTTTAQKIQWSRDLIDWVMGRYNIDKTRMVIGGFSSGAQWTTQFFGPAHAPAIMTDGVAVAISFGGEPIYANIFTSTFKQNVAFVWDVGDADEYGAYQGAGIYDAQSGYDWYTANGFANTDLIVVAGEDHDRSGLFGQIVEREITKWVRAA